MILGRCMCSLLPCILSICSYPVICIHIKLFLSISLKKEKVPVLIIASVNRTDTSPSVTKYNSPFFMAVFDAREQGALTSAVVSG